MAYSAPFAEYEAVNHSSLRNARKLQEHPRNSHSSNTCLVGRCTIGSMSTRTIQDPIRPTLGYRDARAAIEFLVRALGFEVAVIHDETEGSDHILHSLLELPGGGSIHLHSGEPLSIGDLSAVALTGDGYPPFAIHIDVDDPDPLYRRAVEAGAQVIRELQDSPHGVGTRGFIIRDPEGLYWSVGTPLPELVRNTDGHWVPVVE